MMIRFPTSSLDFLCSSALHSEGLLSADVSTTSSGVIGVGKGSAELNLLV